MLVSDPIKLQLWLLINLFKLESLKILLFLVFSKVFCFLVWFINFEEVELLLVYFLINLIYSLNSYIEYFSSIFQTFNGYFYWLAYFLCFIISLAILQFTLFYFHIIIPLVLIQPDFMIYILHILYFCTKHPAWGL